MIFPYIVAIIPKNARQELRIRVVRHAGVPLIRLELMERDRSGVLRPRPGAPGVPGHLAQAVAAAYAEAERLIGGDQ